MKKRFLISFLLMIFIIGLTYSCVFAGDQIGTVVTAMAPVSNEDDLGELGKSINTITAILQIAGTGISIIVVTLLGAKYMLSSAEQKAEIKQRAMPVVIGMVILFGAVNMVAIVGNLANAALY